ncbi:MAG: EVE domain-containing protein [Candidatus Kapaibacterium sp.]
MRRWLFTTSTARYSINDLRCDGVISWESGDDPESCRYIREVMSPGDLAFLLHLDSGNLDGRDVGLAGILQICSDPYADALTVRSSARGVNVPDSHEGRYFIDIKFVRQFSSLILSSELYKQTELADCLRWFQLDASIVRPVTEREWENIQMLRPLDRLYSSPSIS